MTTTIPGPAEPQERADGFLPEMEAATTAVTAALGNLQQHWPRAVQLGIATGASMYHGYPYLFLGAFPGIDEERVRALGLAASLFADSLFVADDLMDEDPTDRDTTVNVLRIQAMQHEGYRILYDLVPAASPFWNRFREYLGLYAAACLEERRFAAPDAEWSELTPELALRIARGKSSLAKFVVAALGDLAGRREPVEPLVSALDRYYVARQMVDDLSDWRQDLERGYPSLLLVRAVTRELAGIERRELASHHERVGRALYLGGHARHVMRLALRFLDEADALTAAYRGLLWHGVTGRLRRRCEKLLGELERIVASVETLRERGPRRLELSLPAPAGAWQELAWRAVRLLVGRWQAGGPEGPPGGGGTARRRPGSGDLLVHALVADALCDADARLDGQLRPLLEAQAQFLLAHRPPGGWGWSLISPGTPPDSWHLALVLRLLARLGWHDAIREHCEPLLTEVLAGEFASGALPPWVPSRPAAHPDHPDELVTADLLSALELADPARFGPWIDRGTAWLESRQGPGGDWRSPGVQGPFLPTSACVRLLAAARPGSSALDAARGFLRRSQQDDGGWGLDGSDAASTGLALRTLAQLQPPQGEAEDAARARRGSEALAALIPIEPEPAEAGGKLTAAFTLQAALAWDRLGAAEGSTPPLLEATP